MTRYAFVRFTFFLISGILAEIFAGGHLFLISSLFAFFIFFYLLVLHLRISILKNINLKIVFSSLAFSTVFCFGYIITYNQTICNLKNNLSNLPGPVMSYSGKIVSDVSAKEKFSIATLSVSDVKNQGGWTKASGKIIIYFPTNTNVKYGDGLIILGEPQPVDGPLNPHQFDYKQYLHFKQIYHQQFVTAGQYQIIGQHKANYIIENAISARSYLEEKLTTLGKNSEEYDIATGIILGTKNNIDAGLKQAYTSAGAMHVLAVSGMQVALFYFIIVILFERMREIKLGKFFFLLLTLSLLWSYAFLTGLSASVLRAIVMFSFVCLAQTYKKNLDIFNLLALSAFLLLINDPFLVFDISFQLSYFAVLGLSIFYKPLSNILTFKYKIFNLAWQATIVSFSAQLATLPLTLYYFHQFPVYSLPANLVIIPLSTLVLYVGLLTLSISWLPSIFNLISAVLKWLVWLLNKSIYVTASLPKSTFTGFPLNQWEVAIIYLAILSFVLLFYFKKIHFLYFGALLIAIISINSTFKKISTGSQHILAVFFSKNISIINFIDGKHSTLVNYNGESDNEKWRENIKNFWIMKGVDRVPICLKYSQLFFKDYKGTEFILWMGKRILIIKHPSKENKEIINKLLPDYLIVSNESMDDFEIVSPNTKIILDSSNKIKFCKRLLNISQHSIHVVAIEGAFIVENFKE